MNHYTLLRPVTIQVPFKGPGNTILQKEVSFDLSNDGNAYTAVTRLSADELIIGNLPAQFHFEIINGQPVFDKGPHDTNFHVITDLAAKIQQQS